MAGRSGQRVHRVNTLMASKRGAESGLPRSSDTAKVGKRPAEPRELRNAIAQRLREARAQAALTQVEASTAVGRRKGWLAKLERGYRSLLFSEAVDLADAYNISVEELYPGRPPTVSPRAFHRQGSHRKPPEGKETN